MYQPTSMRYFCFIILISLLFACKKDDASNDELVLHVRDYKVSCSGYEGQNSCFLVQQGALIGTEDWEYFYEQIEGFNYEEGYKYELLVKKANIENPPADAPNVRYILRKSLSKVKIE